MGTLPDLDMFHDTIASVSVGLENSFLRRELLSAAPTVSASRRLDDEEFTMRSVSQLARDMKDLERHH